MVASKPLPLAPKTSSSLDATSSSHTTPSEGGPSIPESTSAESPSTESPPALETPASEETGSEEEGAGGAFNPVTGEINWDCPCLGGMAHGPCGMQFREAFSCFVFSEKEPKGIDCVGKFKAMQDCFREHPEVYGDGKQRHLSYAGIYIRE
ncbi:hypothetical protein PHLCEN_2v10257 [Hermanssonia centrifuga]|uniref:Mitochondrial intermembrane space import and assembly protein 40 n=1 Tax=Hermanssonia centrifuga TaxID=98765 RepID=A0A2R6NNC1_9APHY|nr:hypothetical protein PHLCEN_2v10257 [Hermanssonia centrifuga]